MQSVKKHLNQNLVIWRFLKNGFEATLRLKENVLILWKWHFLAFWKFVSDEFEIVFWKNKAKHWKLFKSKVGHQKHFRKMVSEIPWGKKQILWIFWNNIFHIAAIFPMTKLKLFSGKVRKSVQGYLNQNLVFSEIYFKVTLRSKANVLSVWKWHFEKSYFEIKNEYSKHLNLEFFYFLQTFERRSSNGFLGKWGKTLKSNEAFGEITLKLSWGQKRMLWTFVIGIFLFFVNF